MSLAKNRGAYQDVEKVLKTLYAANGGDLTFTVQDINERQRQMQRWRARAYMLRKIIRETDGPAYESMHIAMDRKKGILRITFSKEQQFSITLMNETPVADEIQTAADALAVRLRNLTSNDDGR